MDSKYDELPPLSSFGFLDVLSMGSSAIFNFIDNKVVLNSDFAPKNWEKKIHKRAVMAKVKFVPVSQHKYTGLFKGFDCALLRLSLTFKPDPNDKNNNTFAPGFALKILRDGMPSANVSGLYTLGGQGLDYNFMLNPLSNIVPVGNSRGQKIIHWIFSRVSKYPEELRLEDISSYTVAGESIKSPIAPRQIFLVPANSTDLDFSSSKHDFREDFLSLKKGITLYKVKVLGKTEKTKFYGNYKKDDIKSYLEESEEIGEIVLDSEFLASKFSDTGIFFRHEAK